MSTVSQSLEREDRKSAPEVEMPRYSRREVLLTMTGVLLVMLLASLDQTTPLL